MRGHRIGALTCAGAAIAWLAASGARADATAADATVTDGRVADGSLAPRDSASDLGWKIVAYLPNRVFDLCDIVRLRARVGSGFAAGARITRYVPFFVGDYGALWVGLPGPRNRPSVPLPVGTESQAGVEVGPMGVGNQKHAPLYGKGEIGAGGMLYVVGADVGVDPYELVDFLAGFALIDFARDDY